MRKVFAVLALIAAVLLLAAGLLLKYGSDFTQENTLALSAVAAEIAEAPRRGNGVCLQIRTTDPEGLVIVPPFIAEDTAEELLAWVAPGTPLSFRISVSEEALLTNGKGAPLRALEVAGVSVFTLEDASESARTFVRPIVRTCFIASPAMALLGLLALVLFRRRR